MPPSRPATADRQRTVLRGAILSQWPDDDMIADVCVDGGRITAISPSVERRANDRVVVLGGSRIAAGYIDLQVNGGDGFDVTTDPASMWDVARTLPRHGVTSFLPTVISTRAGTIDVALDVVRRPPDRSADAARVLGLHLEGPFIQPDRRGTHPTEHLALPSDARIGGWTASAGVRMVTLAPELPGALDAIRRLTAQGVVVAAGHSAATYDEVGAAVHAGLRTVTHLFNGMEPLDHRAPGLVGRAIADPRLTASLIVDGHHLHPAVVAIAFASLGPSRTILVSDATAAVGRAPGRYVLGDVEITLDDDRVLRNDAGVLAGSVLTLDRAVRNLVSSTGCEPAAAIATATSTPARLLGEPSIGTLTVGARADIVVLDEALEVRATLVDGVAVYDRDGRFAGANATDRTEPRRGAPTWRS